MCGVNNNFVIIFDDEGDFSVLLKQMISSNFEQQIITSEVISKVGKP